MRIASLLLALSVLSAHASTAEEVLEPGDLGYKHDDYHPYYKEIFDQAQCHCSVGECRPTTYRQTSTGIEIKLDGIWVAVPPDAILDPDGVPPELWREPAHVCAMELELPNQGAGNRVTYRIECVLINSGI